MNPTQTLIMAVINVTPDSFSDGGAYYGKGNALQRAESLVAEGADIIDVGGESTRPGASPVSLQEEMDRVLPVIEAIKSTIDIRISVDTRKFEIAREAVRLGATVVNDVSGGVDIRLPTLGKVPEVDFLLMHMKGDPQTMQAAPEYPAGVVSEVRSFLTQRVRAFGEHGVAARRIWVDPGIGFGKTLEQNLTLMKELSALQGLGGRVAIGTSRKSFLARLLGNPELPMPEREPGTIASNLWAYTQGVTVFRVHEVGNLRRALKTWESIVHAGKS